MQNSGDIPDEKTQEKYTQFIPPYPNRYEPDLELNEFPNFTNIEQKNPEETQLALRKEEAKRLNIIYDNNNDFSEDKNIKEIVSNGVKNSNKYKDIYDIDLPSFFMRPSIVSKKSETVEQLKKEEVDYNMEQNNNINNSLNNENINNNVDNDFSTIRNTVKKEEEFKKEGIFDNNDINMKENDVINFKEEKDLKEKENNIKDIKHQKESIDEKEFKDNLSKERKNELDIGFKENDIKTINDDFEIEIDTQNNEFNGDNNEKVKTKEKNKHHKKQKMKNHTSNNNSNTNGKKNDVKPSLVNQITTLYINGLNSNEYYLGEIIEKGPNFPSTLGIVKYMDLVLFSENYFGEKLDFNEISSKEDFQKIIKLIPVGKKKYIFAKDNPPKEEIIREENNLIILHGKGGIETFYYIMKLTGEINGNSEYTIYKVKNNKIIIKHFKDSIGLIDDDNADGFESNLISEDINYNIVQNPDTIYIIMPGQLFLSKYRKLLKKEKEVEEKKMELESKRNYNLNFENNFSFLKEQNYQTINEKKYEIEEKNKNIDKLKEKIKSLSEIEKDYIEKIRRLEEEKNNTKTNEERLKAKITNKRKEFNDYSKVVNNFVQNNIKIEKDIDETINSNIMNYENDEQLNKSKARINELKEKIKNLKEKLYCINCNKNRKEVIFYPCRHLMLCRDCFSKYTDVGNKMKAQCPACKTLSKRFFFVSYE